MPASGLNFHSLGNAAILPATSAGTSAGTQSLERPSYLTQLAAFPSSWTNCCCGTVTMAGVVMLAPSLAFAGIVATYAIERSRR